MKSNSHRKCKKNSESFEDAVLAHLALERIKNSKRTDYLAEEEFKKKAGL